MPEKPRILLSAYQCGPGMGSVSQIGWQWYLRLSEVASVTLATHVRNREPLQAAGAPLPGSEVEYIDTEWFAGPLYRSLKRLFPRSEHAVFLFSSLDYFVYDRALLRKLRAGRDPDRWDVVHVVTPVSPSAATLLHRLGRPTVLGPWNGGLRNPENFPEIMRADSAWLYPIRNLGRLINRLRRCTARASAILVANEATRAAIPEADRGRCRTMLENAVDPDVFPPTPYPPPAGPGIPLRLAFVGRLIPAKGVSMLLEALARFRRESPVELLVVGDGPLLTELQRETAIRELDSCVTFTGALSPGEVAAAIGRSHAFCLPSVRESGGAVLLEAMSCARPVIAVAYGGPAGLVDDEVGLALPPDGREAVVAGLVEGFRDLVARPAMWQARGTAARARVLARYTWQAKIDQALSLYRDVRVP